MASNNISKTMLFTSEEIRRENLKQLLKEVSAALEERGYNSVNQISGYLISNDPAYISSHNNARNNIQQVERYEIIEELVRYYLESE
ncbi:MAG: IreB family regulatory phosphoprotein [Erysipelotrichaceae bacterium]|nr:IreB family regulatory phosphoprotein [Erysipelotrichaceae bacterium]